MNHYTIQVAYLEVVEATGRRYGVSSSHTTRVLVCLAMALQGVGGVSLGTNNRRDNHRY